MTGERRCGPGYASWARRVAGDAVLMADLAASIADTHGWPNYAAIAARHQCHEQRVYGVLSAMERTGRLHVTADGRVRTGGAPTPRLGRINDPHCSKP